MPNKPKRAKPIGHIKSGFSCKNTPKNQETLDFLQREKKEGTIIGQYIIDAVNYYRKYGHLDKLSSSTEEIFAKFIPIIREEVTNIIRRELRGVAVVDPIERAAMIFESEPDNEILQDESVTNSMMSMMNFGK